MFEDEMEEKIKTKESKLKAPLDIIKLDTPFAVEIGFTSDKFSCDSYLWGAEQGIVISNIASNVKGSFKSMMEKIQDRGLIFRIPTPSHRMQEIGKKQNWTLKQDVTGLIFLTNNKKV